ncbi:hypothetical protein RvY_10114-6 [Ramazzottius varieornatus]|uniref:Uncharacterized protein n=1 Tax=Ramazzottius varieornatus TaxID=947166 RepID=A0A1D1VBQ1_RAMVA|nr:hypothetical protein RvY_10114-6 [Ramazzottius varieornatus]
MRMSRRKRKTLLMPRRSVRKTRMKMVRTRKATKMMKRTKKATARPTCLENFPEKNSKSCGAVELSRTLREVILAIYTAKACGSSPEDGPRLRSISTANLLSGVPPC